MRKSLKLRDWRKAQDKVREWEAESKITEETATAPKTLISAWQAFIEDSKARHLKEPTISKYLTLRKHMEAFAENLGIRFVTEFDIGLLTNFRATWKHRNVSALKRLQLLRTFFRFCLDQGWVSNNPAKKIRDPKIEECPTQPLDPKEIERTLAACEKFEGSPLTRLRLRALILLLRFSGLRIGDGVTLARDRISNGRLFLYTWKAQTPVYCPLPDVALQALDAIPTNGKYYFWTGNSKIKTVASHWEAELKKLFESAKVENGRAHRLRDSFAVQLLLQGTPMERVSILLGHRSVRVTERHYAPWIRARQDQAEADVRKSWGAEVRRYRTYSVHGQGAAANHL